MTTQTNTTPGMVAVCAARPRPSVQNNHSKGHQWWKREVYHLLRRDAKIPLYHGARTRCGRDAADWLLIGPLEEVDDNCCQRCLSAYAPGVTR